MAKRGEGAGSNGKKDGLDVVVRANEERRLPEPGASRKQRKRIRGVEVTVSFFQRPDVGAVLAQDNA
jgi:hypothetical protein